MDVDHTICVAPKNGDTGTYDYVNAKPILPVIEKLRALKEQGHRIVLNTSRGMRTYKGDVTKIAENVLPTLTDWLNRNEVPYDEIHIAIFVKIRRRNTRPESRLLFQAILH